MKKQNILLAILVSWLCGLACCQLLTTATQKKASPPFTQYKQLTTQWQETEKKFHQQAATLLQQQEALSKAGGIINALLKEINRDKQNSRQNLQHTLLRQQVAKEQKDTIKWLGNCDTLEQQLTNHLLIDYRQDSLQQVLLQNKDSMITAKSNHYQNLSQHLDYSLWQQGQLETGIKNYAQKLKRMKRNSWLKNIGLVLVSGFMLHRFTQ
jgi:hypothetical protein